MGWCLETNKCLLVCDLPDFFFWSLSFAGSGGNLLTKLQQNTHKKTYLPSILYPLQSRIGHQNKRTCQRFALGLNQPANKEHIVPQISGGERGEKKCIEGEFPQVSKIRKRCGSELIERSWVLNFGNWNCVALKLCTICVKRQHASSQVLGKHELYVYGGGKRQYFLGNHAMCQLPIYSFFFGIHASLPPPLPLQAHLSITAARSRS